MYKCFYTENKRYAGDKIKKRQGGIEGRCINTFILKMNSMLGIR